MSGDDNSLDGAGSVASVSFFLNKFYYNRSLKYFKFQ